MPVLSAPGWSDENRRQLSEMIERDAGKNLPVVFDFDNTLVFGDIGEATLAMLVREGRIAPGRQPGLYPSFKLEDGTEISHETSPDSIAYYEALLDPTIHGEKDPTPLSSGYVWAVQIMEGMSPAEVVETTERVWQLSVSGEIKKIEVRPGGLSYVVPFFYAEMVELIAELLRREFDVWVISASNVWSVRWAISRVLNQQLRALRVEPGIRPAQVIGISTLLFRGDGALCKDAVLVNEDPGYAALQPSTLRQFRLTGLLQFPVPTYSGKVGVIWDALGRRPYLGAGDSPGDLPMLSFCEHRLWIDRVEKPAYQVRMERARQSHPGKWLRQSVRTKNAPSFLSATEPSVPSL